MSFVQEQRLQFQEIDPELLQNLIQRAGTRRGQALGAGCGSDCGRGASCSPRSEAMQELLSRSGLRAESGGGLRSAFSGTDRRGSHPSRRAKSGAPELPLMETDASAEVHTNTSPKTRRAWTRLVVMPLCGTRARWWNTKEKMIRE